MHCDSVRERLNTVVDGERLAGRCYAALAWHCLGCPDCRAFWRRLKRDRRVTRRLPAAPLPAGLKECVLTALPEIEPAPALAGGRTGKRWLPAARVAAGAALLLLLATLIPWHGSLSGPAAVEASVQRANTWHLVGWKLVPGLYGRGHRRVQWEIWGRRSPFFYREQLGKGLSFDDGRQRIVIVKRVRLVRGRPALRLFALRLESGPAPSDVWRGWLTMGTGWRQARAWHETPNGILVFAGSDCGMQGPYSVADTYFTLDKRTWLPVRYEYREHFSNSKAPPWVAETLRAEYDVPIPDSVATLRLPPNVPLIDTLATPTDPSIPPPGGNVQRARGLTVQVTPLAMDRDGNILVRARAWLGNLKLGVEDSGTWFGIGADALHGKGEQARDTPYHTDDGRRYIGFTWPRVYLGSFPAGDYLLPLAPLESRPAGMALPRSLTLNVVIEPEVECPGQTDTQPLFEQGFGFTMPLPYEAAPIDMDAYLPRGYHGRFDGPPGLDASTLASNIASARANEEEILHQPDRAICWARQSLAAVPPVTSTAQGCRLDLAGRYRHAGDDRHAAQWYREVIAASRQRPLGWDHYSPMAREIWREYAWQARGALNYMASHPSRRPAGKAPVSPLRH